MSVLTFTEQASAPDTPSSGKAKLYVNATPRLSLKDDAGNVTVYYPRTRSTWSPAITGSTGDPTVTYTVQLGDYVTDGITVHFHFHIQINTISGGSGDIRISLPFTVVNATGGGTINAARIGGPDVGTDGVFFRAVPSVAYGNLFSNTDNAAATVEQISGLANGDIIAASGFYFLV